MSQKEGKDRRRQKIQEPKEIQSLAWWLTPVIPALWSLRQEDCCKFRILDCSESLSRPGIHREAISKNKTTHAHTHTHTQKQKTNKFCNVAPLVEGLLNIHPAWIRSPAPDSPGVVAPICNLSAWQVVAGGSGVPDHPWLHSEVKASCDRLRRPLCAGSWLPPFGKPVSLASGPIAPSAGRCRTWWVKSCLPFKESGLRDGGA